MESSRSQSTSEVFAGGLGSIRRPALAPDAVGIERVYRLLSESALFSVFSVHDPVHPNEPITSPRDPSRLVGIRVNEELHRFPMGYGYPGDGTSVVPANRFSEAVARVQIRWMVTPEEFRAGPGIEPPLTELDPSRSQRFTMLEGHMTFDDRAGSGIRAFGTGRTFPTLVGGRPQLRIGAVVNVLQGFGRLAGMPGTVVVNGYLEPPDGLFLNFIARFVDPSRRLRAASPLRPPRPTPDPDPGTTFLVLQGEADPDDPVTLNTDAGGRVTGSNLHERLRLVRLDFDAGSPEGLRHTRREGPVVARLDTTTYFDPFSREYPIPLRTAGGTFTFYGPEGRVAGTLRADLAEGRVFPTPTSGSPSPVLRIGGFGPFLGGTGLFEGVVGMLSMNSAISLAPGTLSMLYVLRVSDPDGRFRAACRDTWY